MAVTNIPSSEFKPNYALDADVLQELQRSLAELAIRQHPDEEVFGVWLPYDSPYSDISRTYEASYFPEASEVDMAVEENSEFYLIVDTRDGAKKAIHSNTITGLTAERIESGQPTNMVVIDDLVDMGNFTHREFYDYYRKKGVDLDQCIAVETTLRIGERAAPKHKGVKIADLAYLALFEKLNRGDPPIDRVGVFASINDLTVRSFAALGLQHELLMGRDDYVTSEAATGRTFIPIFIPLDEQNKRLFEAIEPFVLPEIAT